MQISFGLLQNIRVFIFPTHNMNKQSFISAIFDKIRNTCCETLIGSVVRKIVYLLHVVGLPKFPSVCFVKTLHYSVYQSIESALFNQFIYRNGYVRRDKYFIFIPKRIRNCICSSSIINPEGTVRSTEN